MSKKRFVAVLISMVVLNFYAAGPKDAFAGATLTSGPVSLGVNDLGNIIDGDTAIGLTLSGLGDALTPGCW